MQNHSACLRPCAEPKFALSVGPLCLYRAVAEYTECSGHGRCVRETGRCECSFGFRGEACDDISDSDDAQVLVEIAIKQMAQSFRLSQDDSIRGRFFIAFATLHPIS